MTQKEREELKVGDFVSWREEQHQPDEQGYQGRVLAVTDTDFALSCDENGLVYWKHWYEFEVKK